jgi:hypothetical protein
VLGSLGRLGRVGQGNINRYLLVSFSRLIFFQDKSRVQLFMRDSCICCCYCCIIIFLSPFSFLNTVTEKTLL